MSNLIVLLIAVGTAFPAGWLLCRAWTNASSDGESDGKNSISRDKHHAMLQAQRSRYRRQVQRVAKLVRRHEAARDQLREKLNAIDEQTDAQTKETDRLKKALGESGKALESALADAEKQRDLGQQQADRIKQVEHELGLMQIERDELHARSKRQQDAPTDAKAQLTADEEASNRAERGELREKLATAEHRQRELENRLRDRDMRIEELQQTVESWKHRVAPLARQIQSYREAIHKLQSGDKGTPAANTAEEATVEIPKDELQRIRGIGPALERRLNAHGIHSFQQIAALEPVELASLADRLAISSRLPERDEWIRQARELAANDDMAAA